MKTLQSALLILGVSLLSFTSRSQDNSFLTNGLIAFYQFDGNTSDASGSGNNGTVNGATLTQDRFGRPGMAYQFSGTNNSIVCNIPNLPVGAAARTVSLWAKSNPLIKGVALISWGTTPNLFNIFNIGSPYVWSTGTYGGGNGVDSSLVVDTNWHHVVSTYDGAILSLFIDGSLMGTHSMGINTAFSPLIIGAAADSNATDYAGAIDDVRVYNRAISPQEVSELFVGFVPGIITVPAVTITGITNQAYSIQYVEDINSTNWTDLITNIVMQSNFGVFPDTNAINQPKRFYRVISQ